MNYTQIFKRIVPPAVIALLGYCVYATMYVICYQEIYQHHSKAVAIVCWILIGLFDVSALIYWVLIFVRGPGRAPKIPMFPDLVNGELPQQFICDIYGFPLYCSNCKSIKTPRAAHLSDMKYCVLKFDHFCIWIGTVIGERNYLCFVKFLENVLYLCTTSLIVAARYLKFNHNGNIIAVVPVSLLWVWFAGALFAQHTTYVKRNLTTIEDLVKGRFKRFKAIEALEKGENHLNPVMEWFLRRQKRPSNPTLGQRFVSVAHENFRLVVEFTVFDNAYSYGWKKNLINLIFNENSHHLGDNNPQFYTSWRYVLALFMYLVPLVDLPLLLSWRLHHKFVQKEGESDAQFYDRVRPKFNASFNKYLNGRVERKECYIPLYFGINFGVKPESLNDTEACLSLLTAD